MNPTSVVLGEHYKTIYIIADLRRELEEERGFQRSRLCIDLKKLRLTLLRDGFAIPSGESCEHWSFCWYVQGAIVKIKKYM